MSNQASLGDISENSEAKGGEKSSKEWEKEKLGNVAVYQNGNSFSKSQWSEDGYPIIRIQNLTGQQEEYNHFNGDLDEKYKVEEGDILLAWSGTIDLFQWGGEDAALNQHIYRVDTEDGINDIFFQFKLEEVIPRLIALSHGSTMKHVRKADLVNLDVEIPSDIDEQRRIASVLYNVDQAISKTEKIIMQTQRVKKGLMQDLFTEGYYSHEEFEEVRIGPFTYRKPESWSIKTIKESKDGENGLRRGPFGGMLKKEIFVDSGYKVYQQQNVIYEDFDYGDYYITEEKFEDMERFSVEAGDLLISCSGTLGKVARVPRDYEKGVINQALLKFSVDEDLFSTAYMKYFLESRIGQRQLVLSSRGSAMKNMAPMEFVRSSEIFHPDKEEQEKIADTLLTVDKRIQAEEKKKEQLQRLKKGLMQDLLTGSVRTGEDVEVLDEVVEVEG